MSSMKRETHDIGRQILENPTWKTYQNRLQQEACRKRRLRSAFRLLLCAIPVSILAIFALHGGAGFLVQRPKHPDQTSEPLQGAVQKPEEMGKKEVREILEPGRFAGLTQDRFDIRDGDRLYHVHTSLDSSLQQLLAGKLDERHSRYIGIVLMDPDTGRIRAMVGYDKTDPNRNPCINSGFPAASIFKIVTAAAAVEKCGLTPGSEVTYNGAKHTLYKSQIKERTNKYTQRTTFEESFADSINPVFGKLGALSLGRDSLSSLASAFGFNKDIGFELPLAPSRTVLTDEPYQLAEIASGFNHVTTISPVHGALMASVVVNGGKLIEPTVIDRVSDESGQVLYETQPQVIGQVLSPETCKAVFEMMQATVRSGTGRKLFRGIRRDKTLAHIVIGGKTGSINNRSDNVRFDWFVGFGESSEGTDRAVVSVLVAHEEYIGTRAAEYAKMALRSYFQNRSDRTLAAGKRDRQS